MSFKDLRYKRVYVSGLDNLVKDFYIPLLSESKFYRRGSGYFNSRALALAARGISGMLKHGGKMQLLCSVELDADDESVLKDPFAYLRDVESDVMDQLDHPFDELEKKRLGILAELLARKKLEIKVCVKTGGIYHAKIGVFEDDKGNKVVFTGSGNETPGGWFKNQERFNVFKSWEQPEYVRENEELLEKEWNGDMPGIDTYTLSQAFVNKVLKFRDYFEEDIDEPIDPTDVKKKSEWEWTPELAYVFEAPRLFNHADFAYGETAVTPFEHQDYIASKALDDWPPRYLLCDEVGLGKTIEAGLAIHGYRASGMVNRLLILAPKNAMIQWQQELYTKFGLKTWRLDGKHVYGPKLSPDAQEEKEPVDEENPFRTKDNMIVSSQLVRLDERQKQLLQRHYDMIVLDEAHHARATYVGNKRDPNKLLKLMKEIRYQTQSILLLTATPIQIDRRELWDLLDILELPGKWQDPDKFNEFIALLDADPIDWSFLISMVRDSIKYLGFDEEGIGRVKKKYPMVSIPKLKSIIDNEDTKSAYQLSDKEKEALKLMIYMNTPIRRMVFRNTRELLKKYRNLGKFSGKIADRKPEKIPIELEGSKEDIESERGLYDKIDDYVKEYYGKYKDIRKGLGFIMVVYRKRLTSSFEAINISLKRRHARLTTALETGDLSVLFKDDDITEVMDFEEFDEKESLDTSYQILMENNKALKRIWKVIEEEKKYLDGFINDLERLPSDSKYDHFRSKIRDLRDSGEPQIIVFSQFKDTINYLKDHLVAEYTNFVGTYTGDGGLYFRGGDWHSCSKQNLQERFRDMEDPLSILFCTDAAAESLNLQTCSCLFNYDIPWNPMRIEQRIGRVDRIGQESPVVKIFTYSYKDTVEDVAFERCLDRIHDFKSTLGFVQPILEATNKTIRSATMEKSEKTVDEWMDEYIQGIAEVEEDTRIQDLINDYEPQLTSLKDKVPLTQDHLEEILSPRLDEYGWEKDGIIWEKGKKEITFDVKAFDQKGVEAELITPRRTLMPIFGNLPEIPERISYNGNEMVKIEAQSYTGFLINDKNGYRLVNKIDDINNQSGGGNLGTVDDGKRYLDKIITERELERINSQIEMWENRKESWKVRVEMYLDKVFMYVHNKELRPDSLEFFGDEHIKGIWNKYLKTKDKARIRKLIEILGYEPDTDLQYKDKRKAPKSSPRSSKEEDNFYKDIKVIMDRIERLKEQKKLIQG